MEFKLSPEKINQDKDLRRESAKKMCFVLDRKCAEEGYQRPPARRQHIRYGSSDRLRYLRKIGALNSNRRRNSV